MARAGKQTFDEYNDGLLYLLRAIEENPLVAAPLFKILDRSGSLVPFEPTPLQERLVRDVLHHRWLLDLKPRQIGSTTVLAFVMFIKAMLTPGFRVLIVAQGHDAASKIFKMVHTFYETAPPYLKAPVVEINKTTIEFRHKGLVRVTSANSNSVRGSTYNAILGSEVAFWPNPEDTVASVFQSVSSNSDTIIVLESTPNQVNYFYTLWTSDGHGMHRFFAPWTEEPTYTLEEATHEVTPELREYARVNNLTEGQTNWAATALAVKCLGSWPTFQQEYAANDKSCFIQSGDRFFEYPPEWLEAQGHDEEGWRVFGEVTPASAIAIGVDVSSGSAQDLSAIVVVDHSEKNPRLIATWLGRVTVKDLAKIVADAHRTYGGVVAVERTGGWGIGVIEDLRQMRVPQYRNITIGPNGSKIAGDWGWNTTGASRGPMLSNIQHLVNSGKLPIPCPRLRSQMTTYQYIDGRPDHQPGKHDDVIMALAIAAKIAPRAKDEASTKRPAMPASHEEMAKYERIFGKPFNELASTGMFDTGTDDTYGGW
jgi:hypothetical protein